MSDDFDPFHRGQRPPPLGQDVQAPVEGEVQPTDWNTLFQRIPSPMWIYDIQTLRFVAVNDMALRHYGYNREQFLLMTVLDIRPAEDRLRFNQQVKRYPHGLIHGGQWRHRRADGSLIDVEVTSHDIEFGGRPARVVSIEDISHRLRTEQGLRRRELQLRQILADSADGLVVLDEAGVVRMVNPAAARLLGRPPGELEGQLLPELTRHPVGEPLRLHREDGHSTLVETKLSTTEWAGREALIYTLRDITREREVQEELRLLQRAVQAGPYGVMICGASSADLPLLYVNPAFEKMTGYRSEEVLGRNPRFLQGDDHTQAELDTVREALRRQGPCEVMLRNIRRDGTPFWVELKLAPVRDDSGVVSHWIGLQNDLTERRRMEAELTFVASQDVVTGLPRFSAQQEVVDALIADAHDSGARVALLYIDIDRFSAANETMGHATGDQALRVIAERLREQLQGVGRLSRIASDEFAAVISYFPGEFDPLSFADQIRLRMEAPLAVLPYSLFFTCTIGLAEYPDNGESSVELVHCAETAVNRAKKHGRNQVRAFTQDDADQLRERMALASRLRQSMARGEMRVYYQPEVNASDGRVAGMEALLRWDSAEFGLLSSARFLSVAEELGLIVSLGRWVQEAVCEQLARWLAAGHDDIYVSLNMSMQQLLRPTFLLEFKESLRRHGVPAHMLEIELTKATLDEDVGRLNDVLGELRELGTRVALDDFGAGNASLEHLRHLPIDKLKIAREFIDDISTESNDAAIARAMLAMGHQLKLRVLAQGVENPAQLGFLRRNHFDQFQGYLFSHPVDAEGASLLLRQRYLSPEFFNQTRPDQVLLLVDDEENVLRSLTRLFRRDGYKILSTTRVDQAYDLLARNAVQVIVSDQRMPGTSGTEFLGKVKEMYPDTIRMILSGYTDLATVTQSINKGAIYRFLTKPWQDEELREHIRGAFRTYANQQQALRRR